jgi:hypothetical protein
MSFEQRAIARANQLAEIALACLRLEERKCKCGCGIKFRVFPESELVYGSHVCAQAAGWRPKYRFEPEYQMDRRWIIHAIGISAPACA